MRHFVGHFALCLCIVFSVVLDAGILAANQAGDKRPNVIIFFIDDLGYADLGCYGSSFHRTPNIDRLAVSSVQFTNFYSAHPVCSPTRAALMTGKAPQRVGITQWISQPSAVHLPLSEVTVGEAFAEADYKTGYIGKWHLGEKDQHQPTAQGFDWIRCVNRAGQPASYFHPFKRKAKPDDKKYWDVPDLQNTKDGDYLTDAISDQAISFINENKDGPFFLCVAHYAVHTPIQSPKKLVDEIKNRKSKMHPDETPPPIKEINDATTRSRQDNAAYAAMVENLDANVGRVLKRLQELRLAKNTIVVFTSDNGGLSTLPNGRVGPTCNLPLRAGKGWNYEGGIRVPTLLSWPEKLKPTKCDTLAITMDLYPTLLELAQLKPRPEQHLDGCSLASAWAGNPEKKLTSRFLAWHYPHKHGSGHMPSNAIRSGKWKLIHHIERSEFELYDLEKDRGESDNVAGQNPDIVREYGESLQNWVVETSRKTRE